MTRRSDSPPDDLLAAYADDGLDASERAEVERRLAENPAMHEEVAELRAVIAAVRESAPPPRTEPDWARMAARISAACDEVEARPTWSRRLRDWLVALAQPRRAVAVAAVAVAAAGALTLAIMGSGSNSRIETAVDIRPASDGQGAEPTDEELDNEELDNEALDDEDFEEDTVVLPEQLLLLDDELDDAGDGMGFHRAAGLELDTLAEPDYEDLLDDLSKEELDALDEFLRGV